MCVRGENIFLFDVWSMCFCICCFSCISWAYRILMLIKRRTLFLFYQSRNAPRRQSDTLFGRVGDKVTSHVSSLLFRYRANRMTPNDKKKGSKHCTRRAFSDNYISPNWFRSSWKKSFNCHRKQLVFVIPQWLNVCAWIWSISSDLISSKHWIQFKQFFCDRISFKRMFHMQWIHPPFLCIYPKVTFINHSHQLDL